MYNAEFKTDLMSYNYKIDDVFSLISCEMTDFTTNYGYFTTIKDDTGVKL